ncbi:hypothetical protein WICPIJ_007234 [Wickerhamomyces pijperi]|uniref:Uncharacterized protein n=1 Tax=Wickerhamomyces pijperi TaxID=599730 RepID=A0A9P8Q246_WICPI|nr:hypothetical protein WICPIJ_007234 [Wickerhamomyces pijperi]
MNDSVNSDDFKRDLDTLKKPEVPTLHEFKSIVNTSPTDSDEWRIDRRNPGPPLRKPFPIATNKAVPMTPEIPINWTCLFFNFLCVEDGMMVLDELSSFSPVVEVNRISDLTLPERSPSYMVVSSMSSLLGGIGTNVSFKAVRILVIKFSQWVM